MKSPNLHRITVLVDSKDLMMHEDVYTFDEYEEHPQVWKVLAENKQTQSQTIQVAKNKIDRIQIYNQKEPKRLGRVVWCFEDKREEILKQIYEDLSDQMEEMKEKIQKVAENLLKYEHK